MMHIDYYSAEFVQILLIVFNQIARFCVPLFFFLSGYLYGVKFRTKTFHYLPFIKKRLKKILTPYIFWSVFYILLRFLTGDIAYEQFTIAGFIFLLITGSAWGHLYFVVVIFQFYLLFPIFMVSCRFLINSRFKQLILLILTAIWFLAIYYKVHLSINGWEWALLLNNYWLFWWAPFVFWGMLAGFEDWKLAALGEKWQVLFGVTCLVTLLLMSYEILSVYQKSSIEASMIATGNIDARAGFLRPLAVVYAFCLTGLLLNPLVRARLENDLLLQFGKYSFGIYLIHPFVNKCLLYLVKLCAVDVGRDTWVSLYILLVGGLVSLLLVRAFSDVKGVRKLIGFA